MRKIQQLIQATKPTLATKPTPTTKVDYNFDLSFHLYSFSVRKEDGSLGNFDIVPKDVIIYLIVNFLNPFDLGKLIQTCYQFREIGNSEQVWKSFCVRDNCANEGNDWRISYLQQLIAPVFYNPTFDLSTESSLMNDITIEKNVVTKKNAWHFSTHTVKPLLLKKFVARFTIECLGYYGSGGGRHLCDRYSDTMTVLLMTSPSPKQFPINKYVYQNLQSGPAALAYWSLEGVGCGDNSNRVKERRYTSGDVIDFYVDRANRVIKYGKNNTLLHTKTLALDPNMSLESAAIWPVAHLTYDEGKIRINMLSSIPSYLL